MKTFAALAMIAVAACAVDVDAANPYADLFAKKNGATSNTSSTTSTFSQPSGSVSEPQKKHTHAYPTVHVDIWDTVDSELMELMAEVTALMSSVSMQGDTLMSAQMSFTQLMTDVQDLKTANRANNMTIASQKAIDEKQDHKLDKIDSNVTRLESDVTDLENAIALLNKQVTELPSIDELN